MRLSCFLPAKRIACHEENMFSLRFLVAFRRPADDLESETFQKAPEPGRVETHERQSRNPTPDTHPAWYIYLQNWVVLGVNDGTCR